MINFKSAALMLLCLALSMVAPYTAQAKQAAQADQSTDSCTGFIDTVPTTISVPGTWCFNSDLTTDISSGNAVTIRADQVTIDCRGFALTGSPAAIGINAGFHDANSIRNCNIHNFNIGIWIISGGRHVVADNYLENNASYGIWVDNDFGSSRRSRIERNEVVNTGLDAYYAVGIHALGTVKVMDNIVSGVHASTARGIVSRGITSLFSDSGEVTGNLISGVDGERIGGPMLPTPTVGIESFAAEGMRISDNIVEDDGSLLHSVGIECHRASDVANNTLAHFERAILGCKNRGGNVVIP